MPEAAINLTMHALQRTFAVLFSIVVVVNGSIRGADDGEKVPIPRYLWCELAELEVQGEVICELLLQEGSLSPVQQGRGG